RESKIAVAGYANLEAIAHLCRGIEALSRFRGGTTRYRHDLDFQVALGSSRTATRGPGSNATEAPFTRARELCERLGDAPEYPHVTYWLAAIRAYRGQIPEALVGITAALRLAEAAGNRPAAVNATRGSGNLLRMMGAPVEARRMFDRSLAEFDRCNK